MTEFRLRPTGPWRVGHHAGDRERVDVVYHSDALYSAVTHAMKALGWLEEWLDATARSESGSAVRFSSLFPYIGKTKLVIPPRTRTFSQSAQLVPFEIAWNTTVDENRWTLDGESRCLIPSGAQAPFRMAIRSGAAVDRMTGATEPHRIACLEFASNAGWWGLFEASDEWEARVRSALRLAADSGFGGERSRGWGRSREPEFSPANLQNEANGHWWLLSLYSPADTDTVDWAKGEYSAINRSSWTAETKHVRMIEEGSVLFAGSLKGRAITVAPDVYRSGFALAIPAQVSE